MADKKDQINPIDKIRDIVFGNDMETYEKKFSDVFCELESRTQKLAKTIEDKSQTLGWHFDAEKVETMEKFRQINAAIKESESLSSQRVGEVEKSVLEKIRAEVEKLNRQIEERKVDQQKLEHNMEKSLQDMRSELSAEINSLKNLIIGSHLSKADFANSLLELSYQFSEGGAVVPKASKKIDKDM